MIYIIDYGSGNLRSVYNAFRYLQEDVKVCEDPSELKSADRIVLPGVGSSKDAMESLEKRGLVEPILKHIEEDKPFLGICLGLQLLYQRSEERGGCDCLKVVDGEVKLFPKEKNIKVPQIGWNTVKVQNDECPIFKGIKDNTYFYFVHSYYCSGEGSDYTAGVTEYGLSYTSALWKGNTFAVQFHPERSQEEGLKLLKNFTKI